MSLNLRVSAVPLATLSAFLEATSAHSTSDVGDLAGYAGFSASTARRALPTLESLGLLERGDDGLYRVMASGVRRGMTEHDQHLVLRKGLLGCRPFEAVVEGLALGESEHDAIRKALLLLGLPPGDAPKLETLLRFGEDLGVIERSDEGGTRLVPEFAPAPPMNGLEMAQEDVASEARARLFIARTLGRDANNYLDSIDRDLLAEALLKHESDPRRSVESTGQALEDFLRHVAQDAGYGAEGKKASGSGQLANTLHSKSVIHNHHQKLVDAVATVRNATAHRKDKKTLSPWELTPFGALSSHATALVVIRSIHSYTSGGRQTI